jgi:acyl-CoA synthetase (AMP-forming)/AMP-acid ligase II
MFRSEYADVPPVELPIHDAVLGRAAEFGHTPALIDGTNGMTLTYAQVDHFHRRIAAALAEAGVRKGDVLALHSPNTVAFPTAFYAATRAGASVTTVHPLATPEEFAKQLKDAEARWIVTVPPLLEVARRAAGLAGGIEEIFVCDSAPGHRSRIDMLASTAPEPQVDIDPAEDIAALPYSSGTTGVPKGVMLTHRQIATNLAQLEPSIPAKPGDRILAVLPFFHVYGLTALMNAPLRRGATVVVLPRFELETFLAAIQDHRITDLFVAPPIVLALAKHPLIAQYDLSSLRRIVSAAAPLDAQLAAACSQRLGLPPIGQAYGMTELSPGTEMRIVSLDDPGKDLDVGEAGEILIRGPQVMKGCLKRPEDTAAMIDEEGWLFVVDRVKELIKYRGFQVAPAELEALLLTHPGIADAAVIGVPDDNGNEVPRAYVVRQPSAADLSEGEIMMHVAERVSPYKRIRQVSFIDGVPRAASGKILRRELRERA